MSVVREICHNVAIVENGQIVESGLVEEIFMHPKSRAARQLVIEGKDPDEWEQGEKQEESGTTAGSSRAGSAQAATTAAASAAGKASTGTTGNDATVPILHEDKKIRIVFTKNSSFEPVIANMVLTIGHPVNILRAQTQDVGGVARGDMILGLPKDAEMQKKIIDYLLEHGLAVEEID